MIAFPNCKINIGLDIINKRADGYHNLESVFYPLPLKDALEIIPTPHLSEFTFTQTGLPIPGNADENICIKAYKLLAAQYKLPAVQIHLHKKIPTGGGLGGGSADGAFTLVLLNQIFSLSLTTEELMAAAMQLGSDCPFFIQNTTCFSSGRGEILEPISLDLSSYKLVIINPGFSISTAGMFSKIIPSKPDISLKERIQLPISEWKGLIKNDFEKVVFPLFPDLAIIKEKLLASGALYASLSGSGSTLYGIFPKEKGIDPKQFNGCFVAEY